MKGLFPILVMVFCFVVCTYADSDQLLPVPPHLSGSRVEDYDAQRAGFAVISESNAREHAMPAQWCKAGNFINARYYPASPGSQALQINIRRQCFYSSVKDKLPQTGGAYSCPLFIRYSQLLL